MAHLAALTRFDILSITLFAWRTRREAHPLHRPVESTVNNSLSGDLTLSIPDVHTLYLEVCASMGCTFALPAYRFCHGIDIRPTNRESLQILRFMLRSRCPDTHDWAPGSECVRPPCLPASLPYRPWSRPHWR